MSEEAQEERARIREQQIKNPMFYLGYRIKCTSCKWSGPFGDLTFRMHCATCPECSIVLAHT